MRDVVDIHCHFVNFDYLPDEYTIHLLKNAMGPLAGVLKEEWFVKPNILFKILIKSIDVVGVKYLEESLRALRKTDFEKSPEVIDTLMNEGEYFVSKDMKQRYKRGRKGKLILCTPLMMDFIKASYHTTPTKADGVIDYSLQIEEHSKLAARYPWRIMPFFHFHPRRPKVLELCKKAIEKEGFIGVKLYPAMKYYPDPDDNNDKMVRENLKGLYEYIKGRSAGYTIPITTHAQNNSTQAIDLRTHQTRVYTKISNWENVIRDYDLKINFGHYGGTDFLSNSMIKKDEKTFSIACRETIRSLMNRYNTDEKKRIFADTSAHIKRPASYFNSLNKDLDDPKNLIMFGTDLPATTPFTLNKDYINDYENNVDGTDKKERLFKRHAYDFLFEGGKIPDNYVRFLKTYYQGHKIDPFSPSVRPDHIKEIIPGEKYEICP